MSWKNYHLCFLICFLLLSEIFITSVYAKPSRGSTPKSSAARPRPTAAVPQSRSQTPSGALMCVDGSPKNRVLHQQVVQSEFASLIRNPNVNPNRLMQSLDKQPVCVTNDTPAPGLASVVGRYGDFNRYFQSLRNQGRIRPECIAASMMRFVPNNGYICKSPTDATPKAIEADDLDQPCMTPAVVNHVTWVVNQALSCMGALNEPISPEIIYRKINGETGFKFYKAYSGGVGIGQLISDGAARQVLSDRTPIFDVFKKSREPACQPLKQSVLNAERRLETVPGSRAPSASVNAVTQDLVPKNYCNLVSTGQGLAANIMISLMYFAHTRATYAEPKIQKLLNQARIQDLQLRQKFIDLTTLAAYGRRGNLGVSDMATQLEQSMKLASQGSEKVWSDFQRRATMNVTYISQVETNAQSALTRVSKFNEKIGRDFQAQTTADCIEPAK